MTEAMPFPRRPVPPMACVRQHLPGDRVADPRAAVRERLLAAGLRARIRHTGPSVAITAGSPGEGPLPLALPSDREVIEVALYSAIAGPLPRVCRVKNTAEQDTFWVSEPLLDEVKQNPKLDVIEPPAPLPFDAPGNLL